MNWTTETARVIIKLYSFAISAVFGIWCRIPRSKCVHAENSVFTSRPFRDKLEVLAYSKCTKITVPRLYARSMSKYSVSRTTKPSLCGEFYRDEYADRAESSVKSCRFWWLRKRPQSLWNVACGSGFFLKWIMMSDRPFANQASRHSTALIPTSSEATYSEKSSGRKNWEQNLKYFVHGNLSIFAICDLRCCGRWGIHTKLLLQSQQLAGQPALCYFWAAAQCMKSPKYVQVILWSYGCAELHFRRWQPFK